MVPRNFYLTRNLVSGGKKGSFKAVRKDGHTALVFHFKLFEFPVLVSVLARPNVNNFKQTKLSSSPPLPPSLTQQVGLGEPPRKIINLNFWCLKRKICFANLISSVRGLFVCVLMELFLIRWVPRKKAIFNPFTNTVLNNPY